MRDGRWSAHARGRGRARSSRQQQQVHRHVRASSHALGGGGEITPVSHKIPRGARTPPGLIKDYPAARARAAGVRASVPPSHPRRCPLTGRRPGPAVGRTQGAAPHRSGCGTTVRAGGGAGAVTPEPRGPPVKPRTSANSLKRSPDTTPGDESAEALSGWYLSASEVYACVRVCVRARVCLCAARTRGCARPHTPRTRTQHTHTQHTPCALPRASPFA